VELGLRLADLPLAPGVEAVAASSGRDPLELAAASGDDYELLVCAPPERRGELEQAAAWVGVGLSWLGEASAGRGTVLTAPDGTPVRGLAGYEHR
jgi:thiamine-monophosphate kinase